MASAACKFWSEKKSGRARHVAGVGCTSKSTDPAAPGHVQPVPAKAVPPAKTSETETAAGTPTGFPIGAVLGGLALGGAALAGFYFWQQSRG